MSESQDTGPLVDELESLKKRTLKLDGEPRTNADPKDLERIGVLEGLLGAQAVENAGPEIEDPRAIEERMIRRLPLERLCGEIRRRLEQAKAVKARPEHDVALNNLQGVQSIVKEYA